MAVHDHYTIDRQLKDTTILMSHRAVQTTLTVGPTNSLFQDHFHYDFSAAYSLQMSTTWLHQMSKIRL